MHCFYWVCAPISSVSDSFEDINVRFVLFSSFFQLSLGPAQQKLRIISKDFNLHLQNGGFEIIHRFRYSLSLSTKWVSC